MCVWTNIFKFNEKIVRSIFSKIHTPEVINEIRLTFKHYFLYQLIESQKPKSSTMNSYYKMVIRISIHSQHFISFRVRTPKKAKNGNAVVSEMAITYLTVT